MEPEEPDEIDDFLDQAFPTILPEFHCFETGKPFSHCIECGLSVLEDETIPYTITRAIENGEPVVEWALCPACGERLREGISEESKKAIQGFLGEASIDPEHFARSVKEKIASCFICRRKRTEFTGFTISAVCSGEEHINFDTPKLVCHDCEAQVGELISEDTRGYWDRFIEDHFGPPPGMDNEISRPKLVLV